MAPWAGLGHFGRDLPVPPCVASPPSTSAAIHGGLSSVLVLRSEPRRERAARGNPRAAPMMSWPRECAGVLTTQVTPEVWFRVVHLARGSHNSAPLATYHEQTVEIALGPQGAFENGNIGTLTRRMATARMENAVPPSGGTPKPPREPRTPRVVELLRKAMEWQALLESGNAANQADIARREGVTRVRVTQAMGMLRLPPEIQERILSLPDTLHRPPVTERALRPIMTITNSRVQLLEFQKKLI